jgi:hypothetical protein
MNQSTRRFELGLPLFAGLDLGLLMEAQAQVNRQEFAGLTTFVTTLAETGKLRTIRKLAAIWKASDLELKLAESDSSVMSALEDAAAERPFTETFKDAWDFQSALWESLGVTLESSSDAPTAPAKTKGKAGRKASAASPSGS